LLWGNSFLAERTARGLGRIGIVAPVTLKQDVLVEPSGTLFVKQRGGESQGKQ